MTFCRFKKDEEYRAVVEAKYAELLALYRQIRGRDSTEINQIVTGMRLNNDMAKYTPWQFVRLDSVGVV